MKKIFFVFLVLAGCSTQAGTTPKKDVNQINPEVLKSVLSAIIQASNKLESRISVLESKLSKK